MEIIILVTLDVLFLILLACCASLDRRIDRQEKAAGRRLDRLTVRIADYHRELDMLRQHLEALAAPEPGEPDAAEDERLKEKLAEKRFTDGIASILSYDFETGRRAVNAEGK
jgi:hypothetical protein